MWIDPKTGAVACTLSDVRALRPNWSGPSVITDDMIKGLGLMPVTLVTPTYDPIYQSAQEIAPALVGGVWTQQWALTSFPADVAKQNRAAFTQTLSDSIDDSVGDICAKPQRFVVEYEEREAQARAYVNDYGANPAAGPSLVVPARIAAFAKAAGLDPYQAAKITVSQADGLRAALGTLGDLRMRKYELLSVTTTAGLQTLCNEILAKIAAVIVP